MNYFRPQKLSQALSWLADNNAGIAAGCTDLYATSGSQYLQKSGHENLLDITAIEEMGAIETTDEGVRIGAGVSWTTIINTKLSPAFDALKAAAREIGSVQIQNSGTIGGNLCNASPAADGVPPLLTLEASVELSSLSGSRVLQLSEFLLGPRQTALDANEILTSILIPKSAMAGISTFRKLGARKYLVISIAMVAARLEYAEGRIADAAIAVGSCSAVALRLRNLEAALEGIGPDNNIRDLINANIADDELSPIDDIRADAGYRNSSARELVIRTLAELIARGAST